MKGKLTLTIEIDLEKVHPVAFIAIGLLMYGGVI